MKGESRLLKSKCGCERSSLEARIAGSIVNSVVFCHCATTSIYYTSLFWSIRILSMILSCFPLRYNNSTMFSVHFRIVSFENGGYLLATNCYTYIADSTFWVAVFDANSEAWINDLFTIRKRNDSNAERLQIITKNQLKRFVQHRHLWMSTHCLLSMIHSVTFNFKEQLGLDIYYLHSIQIGNQIVVPLL